MIRVHLRLLFVIFALFNHALSRLTKARLQSLIIGKCAGLQKEETIALPPAQGSAVAGSTPTESRHEAKPVHRDLTSPPCRQP
jgi:hypothetical protein